MSESGQDALTAEQPAMPPYDPLDPIEYRMQAGQAYGLYKLNVDQLCTPAGVQLIMQQRNESLRDLKGANDELAKLRKHNQDLTVEITKSRQHDRYVWIEIPASFLVGLASNLLLPPDPRSNSDFWMGAVLLVVGLAILFLWNRAAKKGPSHAKD